MTFQQRLILKLTIGLSPATSTKYYLHLLRLEKDESAIRMLSDALAKTAEDLHYPALNTLFQDVRAHSRSSILYGASDSHRAKSLLKNHPAADPSQEGSLYFSALLLEDSLHAYERAKKYIPEPPRGFYAQRSELNFLFDNYPEALSLARKGRLRDYEFVGLIACARFHDAAAIAPDVAQLISVSQSDVHLIVSVFELWHLILFVAFASNTSEETRAILQRVLQGTVYDIKWVVELAEAFVSRRFSDFVGGFSKLRTRFELSIYTAAVAGELLQAIQENLVRNVVRPLARASIADVAAELQMDVISVGNAMRKLIREGRISGTIDFVEGTLIALGADSEYRELVQVLEQARAIRQDLEISQWIQQYRNQMGKLGGFSKFG
jgi:hypothetical protein